MSIIKVVILNWNGAEHLRAFLPEVIRTVPPATDVVVADNGSTDGSLQLLAELFPQVQVIRLDRNYGYAEGYNRALAMIEADYYILLNSDIRPREGWCEPLIEAFERDPGLFAVAPKLLSLSDPDRFEYAGASGGFIDMLGYPFCRGRILSHIETDHGQYDGYREVFWASGACMACRSDIYRQLGGLDDEFFAHMEEIDLCWRAQLYGYRIAVEPASVVYHLGGGTLPNNSPRKIYLNFRNNLAMLYKNLPAVSLWPVLLTRMVLDGFSALVFLLQGRVDFFREVWRAHRDFFKWRSRLRPKRETIRQQGVGKVRQVYRGSIVLRYFFLHKTFRNLL